MGPSDPALAGEEEVTYLDMQESGFPSRHPWTPD